MKAAEPRGGAEKRIFQLNRTPVLSVIAMSVEREGLRRSKALPLGRGYTHTQLVVNKGWSSCSERTEKKRGSSEPALEKSAGGAVRTLAHKPDDQSCGKTSKDAAPDKYSGP